MRCAALSRTSHDVIDDRLRRVAEVERCARLCPTGRRKLLGVAEHAVGFGHGDEGLRLGLRGAAGDDDLRLRPVAAQRADRLARLTHRFRRYRASIDDDGVGKTGGLRLAADHFRFGGVEPAAESDDLDAHGIRLRHRQTKRRRTALCVRIRPDRSSARDRRFRATRWRDRHRAASPSPCGRCA